jgi:hypothetical protein
MICADSPGAFCQITSLFHALVKMDSMVFSPLRHSGFGGPGLPALLARPPGRQKAKAPDDTKQISPTAIWRFKDTCPQSLPKIERSRRRDKIRCRNWAWPAKITSTRHSCLESFDMGIKP